MSNEQDEIAKLRNQLQSAKANAECARAAEIRQKRAQRVVGERLFTLARKWHFSGDQSAAACADELLEALK